MGSFYVSLYFRNRLNSLDLDRIRRIYLGGVSTAQQLLIARPRQRVVSADSGGSRRGRIVAK